jgi:hypothetical protein
MLPRTLNCCRAAGIFLFAYYKETSESAALPSGRVKIFCSEQLQVGATVKKKIRGNVGLNSRSNHHDV